MSEHVHGTAGSADVSGGRITPKGSSRVDLAKANRVVNDGDLIEKRLYADALEVYETVRREHPFTPTTLFEVRQRVEELEAKIEKRGAAPAPAGEPKRGNARGLDLIDR